MGLNTSAGMLASLLCERISTCGCQHEHFAMLLKELWLNVALEIFSKTDKVKCYVGFTFFFKKKLISLSVYTQVS